MAAWFILGIGAVVVGVILLVANLPNYRRRQRIVATPTTPIARASGDGVVEIKGRILVSEQGLVQAPFSGRHVVWCRVTVQELRSAGKSRHWATILTESDGRMFHVDDGSGERAHVLPAGANVVLEKQDVAQSGTFNDAPPHLVAFLAARGHKTTSWLGLNKSMRYEEELLVPDDPIYVLGPSRRDAGPPRHDGYRVAPTTQLVLFAGVGPEGELLVTNKSEEELTSHLMGGFFGGIFALVVGGLLVLVGFVLSIVHAVQN